MDPADGQRSRETRSVHFGVKQFAIEKVCHEVLCTPRCKQYTARPQSVQCELPIPLTADDGSPVAGCWAYAAPMLLKIERTCDRPLQTIGKPVEPFFRGPTPDVCPGEGGPDTEPLLAHRH